MERLKRHDRGEKLSVTELSNPCRGRYYFFLVAGLKKRDWSLGYVSAIDSNGRTIWIVDAHRGDGKRFIVRADEKRTAFVELESVIRAWRLLPSPIDGFKG